VAVRLPSSTYQAPIGSRPRSRWSGLSGQLRRYTHLARMRFRVLSQSTLPFAFARRLTTMDLRVNGLTWWHLQSHKSWSEGQLLQFTLKTKTQDQTASPTDVKASTHDQAPSPNQREVAVRLSSLRFVATGISQVGFFHRNHGIRQLDRASPSRTETTIPNLSVDLAQQGLGVQSLRSSHLPTPTLRLGTTGAWAESSYRFSSPARSVSS
jgi:hypothetical protein